MRARVHSPMNLFQISAGDGRGGQRDRVAAGAARDPHGPEQRGRGGAGDAEGGGRRHRVPPGAGRLLLHSVHGEHGRARAAAAGLQAGSGTPLIRQSARAILLCPSTERARGSRPSRGTLGDAWQLYLLRALELLLVVPSRDMGCLL